MVNSFVIRKMKSDEVRNIAIKWAAKEGWNPGLNDSESFFKTDRNGFLIGLLNGKPIACISAVSYGNNFGFMGFYIVKPEHRGKGYGLKLWNAAMGYLNGMNIALDGVLAQQDNYKKSGFKFAYCNIRYEGKSIKSKKHFKEIVKVSEIPFRDLLDYDSRLFPAPRRVFLQKWIKMQDSKAIAALVNGKLSGYCVTRKCINGYKIGPLFADNKEIAEMLFVTANNLLRKGTKIYLDAPELNKSATELAKKYGMVKVFETARMYTKYVPDTDNQKVYSVTTFELG